MDFQTALSYIPFDRRAALAVGFTLPDSTGGTALFADISGFTRLTEALVQAYGPRRGAEALTRYLDSVYDALISQIRAYRGSVVNFSGDGLICWFDGTAVESARRATTCAVQTQNAIRGLPSILITGQEPMTLALKITVASGWARRFLVGDPQIQVLDVLAGRTIDQLMDAVTQTRRAEVVAHHSTCDLLNEELDILEEREACAVIGGLRGEAEADEWPIVDAAAARDIRPWLLPEVYRRLQEGQGEFITELRPAVALFLKFTRLDFDGDEQAGSRLAVYIEGVQHVLKRYQGTLIQLTVGDKGNFLYAAFGAPLSYENEAQRAASAALELQALRFDGISAVQIGISQGMMRVGAYGGAGAHTYGVLGDAVNLAARLMEYAGAGQIIASAEVAKSAKKGFVWHELPGITVKGKHTPVAIAQLTGETKMTTDTTSAHILVGRERELVILLTALKPLADGRSVGLITVLGEAGMGKTQMTRQARSHLRDSVSWYVCPSDRILDRSLYPFGRLLMDYLRQEPHESTTHLGDQSYERLETALKYTADAAPDVADQLLDGISFLAALIGLHRPGSAYEVTPPTDRYSRTLAAIKTLVLAECRRRPVVLQIDEAQWLDSDSRELLAMLLQEAARQNAPLGVIITTRDADSRIPGEFSRRSIELRALQPQAIANLTAQHLGNAPSAEFVTLLFEKTGGNPFFIMQLLRSLQEGGALVQTADDGWTIHRDTVAEVPASVHGIMVARFDRLAAHLRPVVQAAAVLGTDFGLEVLQHMLPDIEPLPLIIVEIEAEGIWMSGEDKRYHFANALMRDSIIDIQPSSRLRVLHERAGQAIEAIYAHNLREYAADLAYHFGRAENAEKERDYAVLAGETAASRFANREAVRYLSRALELAPGEDIPFRIELLLRREAVYDLIGARDLQAADLDTLERLAGALLDVRYWGQVALRQAHYAETTGDFAAAISNGKKVLALARQAALPDLEVDGYLILGRALGWQGEYTAARQNLQAALQLAKDENLVLQEATSLRNLGIVDFAQGQYDEAQTLQERALELSRQIGDRRGESGALNNLSVISRELHRLEDTRTYKAQALELSRQIGDRRTEASIGPQWVSSAIDHEPYSRRLALYQQMLTMQREVKNARGEVTQLYELGELGVAYADVQLAEESLRQALDRARQIGYSRGEIKALLGLAALYRWLNAYDAATEISQQILALAESAGNQQQAVQARLLLVEAALGQRRYADAESGYETLEQRCAEPNLASFLPEVFAGRGMLALALGDLTRARGYIEQAFGHLTELPTWESVPVYWACYRTSQYTGLPDPNRWLELAFDLLQKQAAQIDYPDLQQAFWEVYPLHREIMAARVWALYSAL